MLLAVSVILTLIASGAPVVFQAPATLMRGVVPTPVTEYPVLCMAVVFAAEVTSNFVPGLAVPIPTFSLKTRLLTAGLRTVLLGKYLDHQTAHVDPPCRRQQVF